MTKKGFEFENWENSFYIFIVKFYYEKEGGGRGRAKERNKEREHFKNKPNEQGVVTVRKVERVTEREREKEGSPGLAAPREEWKVSSRF